MENKKVVFCTVGWMKNYCGMHDGDKAINGGSFNGENDGNGMETNNFMVHNGKCYGYVMHTGKQLHLEHLDKKYTKLDKIDGVTVVWVATNGIVKPSIVGWYENATMFREWQYYEDDRLGKEAQDYSFVAAAKDCYLLPEKERNFVVPRAGQSGKGKGIGQSPVWYAEGKWAQENFIPNILEYLEKSKVKCQKLFNYFTEAELKVVAEDKGEDAHEILADIVEIFQLDWFSRDYNKMISLANLAVQKEQSFDTYLGRGDVLKEIFYLDEAEADFKKAISYDKGTLLARRELMNIYFTEKRRKEAIAMGEEILKYEVEQRSSAPVDVMCDFLYHVLRDLVCLCIDEHDYTQAWKFFNKLENVRFINYKDEVAEFKKYVLECEG